MPTGNWKCVVCLVNTEKKGEVKKKRKILEEISEDAFLFNVQNLYFHFI
jgi:hypothetical protein